VERHSRFVALVKVPSKDTATAVAALTRHVRKLPAARIRRARRIFLIDWFLKNEKSKFVVPGPVKRLRGAFPLRLKHWREAGFTGPPSLVALDRN
jgi:hypothetical protein